MPGRANAINCVNGHKYEPDNFYLYTGKDGRVRRTCRTCQAKRELKTKKKRQAKRFSNVSYE